MRSPLTDEACAPAPQRLRESVVRVFPVIVLLFLPACVALVATEATAAATVPASSVFHHAVLQPATGADDAALSIAADETSREESTACPLGLAPGSYETATQASRPCNALHLLPPRISASGLAPWRAPPPASRL